MNTETFNKLLDELDGNSLETLKQKNAKYASPDDCLHNFYSGAEIMGGTPAQCTWGYMTKHLVALRDKVEKNDFHDRDDLLEKCQDIINYIRFIWLIGNEEMSKYTSGVAIEKEQTINKDRTLACEIADKQTQNALSRVRAELQVLLTRQNKFLEAQTLYEITDEEIV